MKVKIKQPSSYYGYTLGKTFEKIGLERLWDWFCESKLSVWFFKILDALYAWHLNRSVKVEVDNFDLWNLDNTLAHVIHPALVKFREVSDTRMGCFFTYDVDVPDYMKSLRMGEEESDVGITDGSYHKLREYWVLDEMIFAFGEMSNGAENEPDITLGNAAFDAYHERISNGLLLFAKYYRSLWD